MSWRTLVHPHVLQQVNARVMSSHTLLLCRLQCEVPLPPGRHQRPEGWEARANAPCGPPQAAGRVLPGLCAGAWPDDPLRGEPGALCGRPYPGAPS